MLHAVIHVRVVAAWFEKAWFGRRTVWGTTSVLSGVGGSDDIGRTSTLRLPEGGRSKTKRDDLASWNAAAVENIAERAILSEMGRNSSEKGRKFQQI